MNELKRQEAEILDIMESLLDVADMKCTGPLYADDPPRSGMCRIPEDDARKFRQFIADRRAASEQKALMLSQLWQLGGEPVRLHWIGRLSDREDRWAIVNMVHPQGTLWDLGDYGKTWLAYTHKPEG